MTMNPLPPQAYTKDTLTKAYTWLLHQNPSLKELASTPDILVSLFLKAQRNGEDSLDTPSIQNFKNELKNLAGLMGELDHQKQPAPVVQAPVAPPAPPPSQAKIFHSHPQHPQHAPPPPPQPQVHIQTHTQNQSVNIQNNHVTVDLVSQLDIKSKAMINEVRDQLNLSCDLEAVRLLLSLGYTKAKSLYS